MNKKLLILFGLLSISTLAFAQDEDFGVIDEIGENFEDDGEYTEGIIVEDPGHDINYEDNWDWEYTEGFIPEYEEHDINYEDNWDWEFDLEFDSSEGVILGEPFIQPEIVEAVNQDGGFLDR